MDIKELRREFHKIPETGFKEYKTTRKIISYLKNFENGKLIFGKRLYGESEVSSDADIDEGYTGSLIEFGHAPFFMFRSDIDALPVLESTSDEHVPKNLGFRSEIDGNMHACGHDGHISIALKLAEKFNEEPNLYSGRGVRILFQPAEEGVQGAAKIPEFVTKDVDNMIGYHIGLGEPEGFIGVGSTNFLGVKKLLVKFFGKSAHAANNPENGISALNMALAFINLNRTLIEDSKKKRVMNIGMIHGGNALNIVMDEITLGIDLRAIDNDVLDEMYETILKTSRNISEAVGGSSTVEIIGEARGYVEENRELTEKLSKNLRDAGFKTTLNPNFGASEDVTKYILDVKENGGKAIHLLFGADLAGSHHSSTFDFDDENLEKYFNATLLTYESMLKN